MLDLKLKFLRCGENDPDLQSKDCAYKKNSVIWIYPNDQSMRKSGIGEHDQFIKTKDNKVFFGRFSESKRTDITFPSAWKAISRRSMELSYDRGAYWVTDLNTAGQPSYFEIDDKHPVMLTPGMTIYAGEDKSQFLEVEEVDHMPSSQYTKKGLQLLRVAYEKDFSKDCHGYHHLNNEANSKFDKGEGQTKGYIKIYDWQTDERIERQCHNNVEIPLVNKATEEYKKLNCIVVDIPNDEGINCWGYLCYDKMCGWHLKASKRGAAASKGLRITLKAMEQIHESKGSDRLLL